jgi:sulfide:quinone oxidoreductase
MGAGVGGIVVASELQAKVGSKASVTLIERKSRFQFPPSFPWVVTGMRTPAQVERGLGLLERKGIRNVRQEVVSLDLATKTVRTVHDTVPYDQLVIALGAEYAPEAVSGFAEHAHHMYDLDSAIRMRKAVEEFEGGTVAIGVSRLPFKCPAAPYEMAFLLDDVFRRRGLRERVKIEFFTPEGAPLPAAGPENGSKVLELLQERGIAYHPKRKLKEVVPGSLTFEEGASLTFDLLVCVPPHRAPKPVVDAGLTDASGWVPVDPRTLQTKLPDVFAIGDVTALATPNGFVPLLPKAGVFASGQGKVVAHNLAVTILGRGSPHAWDGYGACFLEVARGKSAFMSGNFLAAPRPELVLRSPGAIYHTQKVLFEKYWLRHWF